MTLNRKGYADAFLMDLFKAFDCIDHHLLIGKMHAYGFGRNSLLMIHRYFSQRRQRVKINDLFSTWKEVQTIRFPQGSVFGPLLLNIYCLTYLLNITLVQEPKNMGKITNRN